MTFRLTAVCLATLAASATAQSTKYGPLAARLPASARALGMGDVAIAGRDDDVIFYSPAQLVSARGTSASFERMSPDTYGGTMSTVLRLGSGGLAVGVNRLEYRAAYAVYPISRADILQPNIGQPAGSSTLAAVGFAQVLKGYRIGVVANYAVDEIGLDRFRNALGDVGVAHDYGRYTAALSLQHLGAPMNEYSSVLLSTGRIQPPMMATLGGGWGGPAGPLDLIATTAVSATKEGHVSPAIGGEASWSWLSGYAIAARAGVRYPRNVGDSKYTGGLGFTADRVSIDLAGEVMTNDKVGLRAGFRIR